jgi:adenosine deaminase
VALGADDPLLFGSRLAGQYAVLRAAQELADDELATLARMSLRRSCAPDDIRDRALAGVDAWLTLPDAAHGPAPPPRPEVED